MNMIDTIMADVSKVARMIEPAFAFVALAQSVTGVGGPGAAQAIKVIEAAVKSFADGAAGKLTADQVMEEFAKLKAGLVANDAAADADLASRFPPG